MRRRDLQLPSGNPRSIALDASRGRYSDPRDIIAAMLRCSASTITSTMRPPLLADNVVDGIPVQTVEVL
jgi:hypothetical protein